MQLPSLQLDSLDELTATLEFMADWRSRLDRRIALFDLPDFDLMLLQAEVKAWGYCARCIEKAIKK